MNWIALPAAAFWIAVTPVHGKLVVSGPVDRGPKCAYLTVDPVSRHSALRKGACVRDGTRTVYAPRSPWTKVYVGRKLAFRYQDSSTGRPVSATSGDTLWLYDVATDRGAIIQRWSLGTGTLLQEIRFPVQLYRPALAANAAGAWLMAAVNGGASGRPAAALYHVTSRVTVVRRGTARAALWMATHGRTLWLETVAGTHTFELWRYDGTRGRRLWTRRSPSLTSSMFGGGATYGGGSLWGIAAPYCATTVRVVRVDGDTGAMRTVARAPLLDCNQFGAAAYVRGAFWFVDGNKLFGVR